MNKQGKEVRKMNNVELLEYYLPDTADHMINDLNINKEQINDWIDPHYIKVLTDITRNNNVPANEEKLKSLEDLIQAIELALDLRNKDKVILASKMNNVEILEYYLPDLADYMINDLNINKEQINDWTDSQYIKFLIDINRNADAVECDVNLIHIKDSIQAIELAVDLRKKDKVMLS